jgi:single-strand DNA-binding protein
MINSVCLVGNLGVDPELRYTPSGCAVARWSIAVNEVFKDSSGTKDQRTYWFRCVAFGRLAEVAQEYLTKGARIAVRGQLIQRTWEDQDGNKRSTVEVRVREMQMLGKNGGAKPAVSESEEEPPAVAEDDIPF